MIAEASPSLAVFLRLAALTRARRGQLCGLHWADVDLDAATIRRTRALAKIPGGWRCGHVDGLVGTFSPCRGRAAPR